MHPSVRIAMHVFLLVHLFMMTASIMKNARIEHAIVDVVPERPGELLEATLDLPQRYQWTFGLHQNWSMFTPNPRLSTSWMEAVGILPDKSRVKIELPHDTPSPFDIKWTYDRWGKLERNAIGGHRKKLRMAFVRWICRTHSEPLAQVEIASRTQTTPPPAKHADAKRERWPIRRKVIETWNCKKRP